MGLAPAHASDNIIEKLNEFKQKNTITPFEIAKLRRDAEKFGENFVAERDMVLGMIATLEGNVAEMRRRHENSIKLCPGFVDFYSNYAVSLSESYFFSESARLNLKSFRMGIERPDLSKLKEGIKNYFLSGEITEATAIANEFSGLSKTLNDFNYVIASCDIEKQWKENNYNLDQFVQKMDVIQSVLREKKIRNNAITLTREQSPNDSWWEISIRLFASYANVIEIEDEIDSRLEQSGISEAISQGYVSVSFDCCDSFLDIAKKISDGAELTDMVEIDESLLKRIESVLR